MKIFRIEIYHNNGGFVLFIDDLVNKTFSPDTNFAKLLFRNFRCYNLFQYHFEKFPPPLLFFLQFYQVIVQITLQDISILTTGNKKLLATFHRCTYTLKNLKKN